MMRLFKKNLQCNYKENLWCVYKEKLRCIYKKDDAFLKEKFRCNLPYGNHVRQRMFSDLWPGSLQLYFAFIKEYLVRLQK